MLSAAIANSFSANGTAAHKVSTVARLAVMHMPRSKPFRPIDTATRGGTVVEVKHGHQQEIARAYCRDSVSAGE